ncbi:hypothetical protein [Ectopseudomonas mendocina]|uniref:hypothetical protein n=1 Tax=Ectopseudomonas mendocina TaxID=300 RepID=UPI0017FF67F4|nr:MULTISPECIES: hypothetical protein [Pseudomonas]MDF2077646.1 hypothetical protein [Pseudomonas mendocina]
MKQVRKQMLAAASLAADKQRPIDTTKVIHLFAQVSRRAAIAQKLEGLPPAFELAQASACLCLLQDLDQTWNFHR